MSSVWRVAAILNEPLPDTLRFAAWYLDEGADRLTLFFDNPQDPAIGVLGSHPRIDCIACTPQFWEDLGLTQDARFPKRQNAALTSAYRAQTDGWFLNVDADEFLFVEGRSIGDMLAEQPADVQAVRIITAELVKPREPRSETLFRRPMERDAARRVYGEHAGLFGPRRQGLVGHPQGKSATRAGLGNANVRQHWVELPGSGRATEALLDAGQSCYLLHFIGQGYEVWRAKLDWRSGSRGFTNPLTARIAEASGGPDPERALQELYSILHEMDDATLERLQNEGALVSLILDLDGRAERMFGQTKP